MPDGTCGLGTTWTLALSLGPVLAGTGCGTRRALGWLGLWMLIWGWEVVTAFPWYCKGSGKPPVATDPGAASVWNRSFVAFQVSEKSAQALLFAAQRLVGAMIS